jgi:hypothetical protein
VYQLRPSGRLTGSIQICVVIVVCLTSILFGAFEIGWLVLDDSLLTY